jgi:hypothetical protein
VEWRWARVPDLRILDEPTKNSMSFKRLQVSLKRDTPITGQIVLTMDIQIHKLQKAQI